MTDLKVVITDGAYADLLHIGRTIAVDNPARAETFIAELYERCQKLSAQPRAYPLIPRWEEQGIRRIVHGNYLIFYRVGDRAVEVLHVLHGSMDYEEILFG